MRRAAVVVAGATLAKVVVTLFLELTSVESYLWVCAGHPALGYYDYPGMAAWLIGMSTSLAGHSPLGIRLLTLVCAAGTAWMICLTARRLYGERTAERAAWLAALLPLFLIHGTMATPDAPLLLFWSAAVWALAVVFTGGPRGHWLLAGFFAGLAMDSKYQAVFLPAGVLGFLLCSRDHRGWLRRRDPYLAVVVALLAFAPTLVWNAAHGWESLAYQGASRFTERGFRAEELFDFPFSQFKLLTPVVAWVAWISGGRALLRWKTTSWQDRFCAALGMPVLLFFAVLVFVRPVRGHWPAPAYVTLVLLASSTSLRWERRALDWTAAALAVGLAMAALVVPFLPEERVTGWGRLAEEVRKRKPEFVIGREYHLASQLAYHLRPMTGVEFTALGVPSKAFPHWWRAAAWRGKTAVIVTEPKYESEDRALAATHFESLGPSEAVEVPRFRGRERYVIFWAKGYR